MKQVTAEEIIVMEDADAIPLLISMLDSGANSNDIPCVLWENNKLAGFQSADNDNQEINT